MIRVVEAISDTNIGGAGVLLLNRMRHSDRRRFDTVVILPQKSALAERFRDVGINTVEVKVSGDRSFDPRSVGAYARVIRAVGPHVINSHGCLSARIAAGICGVPVKIYTRHSVFDIKAWQKSLPSRALVRFVTRLLSDRVIAVAHSARDQLVRLGVEKDMISVIINGAEGLRRVDEAQCRALRKRLGILDGSTVVSIFARLEQYKDHMCLLKAAKILLGDGGDYFFLIVGTGSMAEELRREARRMGICGRVLFVGFAEDVSPYMSITDINVNCSVGTETSSLALSEGMSIGVPAVVSDFGGNPYMIRNGVNGYLYRRGDHRELARRISEMRRYGYEEMSLRCIERFKAELNAENMTRKTEKLYAELVAERRKRYKNKDHGSR